MCIILAMNLNIVHMSILYINTLSWGSSHASVGYSLRPTRTLSLSVDAMCLSHCYKVLSDPIWWELDEQMSKNSIIIVAFLTEVQVLIQKHIKLGTLARFCRLQFMAYTHVESLDGCRVSFSLLSKSSIIVVACLDWGAGINPEAFGLMGWLIELLKGLAWLIELFYW